MVGCNAFSGIGLSTQSFSRYYRFGLRPRVFSADARLVILLEKLTNEQVVHMTTTTMDFQRSVEMVRNQLLGRIRFFVSLNGQKAEV
ncbi:unnamed protein product, partial [Iphiclides podalirius]